MWKAILFPSSFWDTFSVRCSSIFNAKIIGKSVWRQHVHSACYWAWLLVPKLLIQFLRKNQICQNTQRVSQKSRLHMLLGMWTGHPNLSRFGNDNLTKNHQNWMQKKGVERTLVSHRLELPKYAQNHSNLLQKHPWSRLEQHSKHLSFEVHVFACPELELHLWVKPGAGPILQPYRLVNGNFCWQSQLPW